MDSKSLFLYWHKIDLSRAILSSYAMPSHHTHHPLSSLIICHALPPHKPSPLISHSMPCPPATHTIPSHLSSYAMPSHHTHHPLSSLIACHALPPHTPSPLISHHMPCPPTTHHFLNRFGAPPEWVIFNEVVHSKHTMIREISKIDPRWLLEIASHYFTIK
jgi:hypothetical protein